MKILLVNPNTSKLTTNALAEGARAAAAPETVVEAVTAPFGVRLISTSSEGVVGAHATLTAIAERADDCDAVVIGGFKDYGIEAARDLFPINVLGMGESAMRAVMLFGQRFAIITVGAAMIGPMKSFAADWGVGGLLTGVHVVADIAGGANPSDAELTEASLELGGRCMSEDGAEAVLFAGAPLVKIGAALIRDRKLPVIEGIAAAVKYAEFLHSMGLLPSKREPAGQVREVVGISRPLADIMSRVRR